MIENIQIHISSFFYSNICTNVKNKYEKGVSNHFWFLKKKIIRFSKIENHVVTFFSWFWFGFKKKKNKFLEHVII